MIDMKRRTSISKDFFILSLDITGITNDMVLKRPYFSDILSDLIDFIGNLYIVGHNVNF